MKRLLLAGGGHAHLHVLKTLAEHRWPDVEVVLISPQARQIYSGMVPGWIAGHYTLEQCAARLQPLARAARVRFLQDRLIGVNAERRTVRCAQAGELHYDLLSIDTGAQLGTSPLASSGARLLPVRPLEEFVVGWNQQLEHFRHTGQARVAVVGGGAAGVELALAIRYRLAKGFPADRVRVVLVVGSGLLGGHGAPVVSRVRRALDDHGVEVVQGPAAGNAQGITLPTGTELAADCIVAATGGVPPDWLAASGLALAADGFLAVGPGQQSTSHPQVFAAGDVASRIDAPHGRSGVYAVRAGPVLGVNLARALAGQEPLPYQPQKRSLYLLATGPKEAIVSWGGLSARCRLAWRWKDWLDRRFLRKYDLAW